MAAFANNSGGFIVFGVRDAPRDLIGVNSQDFDRIDSAEITQYLNSRFAPELHWEVFPVDVSGVGLGVFAVRQSKDRPVICMGADGNTLREADIYYRYRGRSERIRYPELQRVLREQQLRERNTLLKHFSRIVQIGVENVGVVDLAGGVLSGQGGRLLLEKNVLDRVQLVREGRFAESDESGTPTLRIVGDVDVVSPNALTPTRTVTRPLVIGERELLLGFLRQESPGEAAQYLRQACRESSPYMPIYHYASAANLSHTELRALVERETKRSEMLLRRIDGAAVCPIGSLDSGTLSALDRRRFLEGVRRGDVAGLTQANRLRLFEAVTHYRPSSPPEALLGLLAGIVESEFETLRSPERTVCRKAVAHLDEALNRTVSG